MVCNTYLKINTIYKFHLKIIVIFQRQIHISYMDFSSQTSYDIMSTDTSPVWPTQLLCSDLLRQHDNTNIFDLIFFTQWNIMVCFLLYHFKLHLLQDADFDKWCNFMEYNRNISLGENDIYYSSSFFVYKLLQCFCALCHVLYNFLLVVSFTSFRVVFRMLSPTTFKPSLFYIIFILLCIVYQFCCRFWHHLFVIMLLHILQHFSFCCFSYLFCLFILYILCHDIWHYLHVIVHFTTFLTVFFFFT